MSLFSMCRRPYRSMHAYAYNTNMTAGSAAGGRIQHAVATGAVGRRLQYPGYGRSMRSHCKEIHGISNSIPLFGWHQHEEAMSSVNCLHHYGVEGTTACQGSSWIHSIRCHVNNTNCIIICSPDEDEDGRVSFRIDQGELMIKASTKELSFPIHHKSWGKQLQFCYKSNNNNKFQVFDQVFIKPATA